MQERETVEQYLKRGGAIERNPQVLDTITSIWTIAGERSNSTGATPYVDPENQGVKQVSWKSVQSDAAFDEYSDPASNDEAYWKKLNSKLDRVIKKLKIDPLPFK
jgi:hypothetical protein|tara:strand:- start:813 stop:1127 length:315 start_codon:yes stop_codon:yes gene_type:complete